MTSETFKSATTSHFDKKFSKLTGKNEVFRRQIVNKMKGIRQNPEIGEPKSGNLRGLRGLHISEHFVIVYLIYKNFVIFIHIDHHDQVYDAETIKRLMRRLATDTKLLTILHKASIGSFDFLKFIDSIGRN